jgi:hypothetical protein
VDDALGVSKGQPTGHGLGDLHGPLRQKRGVLPDHVGQGLALHILHDDVVGSVVGAGVEHADHIGVIEGCGGLGLAAEPGHE